MNTTDPPTPLLSVDDLARYLKVTKWTVYKMNTRGTGPPYTIVGIQARYKLADVDAWLEAGGSAHVRDLLRQ